MPSDKSKNGAPWTDGGPGMGGAGDKSFAYRQSRKAFIVACEKAGADAISRVHPAKGPDGKPLFCDSAAFGPRLGSKGLLVAAYGAPGAGVLQALLAAPGLPPLPADTRLVLVHAADPAAFAWNDAGHSDESWNAATLAAVAAEDLRRARLLRILGLGGAAAFAAPAGTRVATTQIPPDGRAKASILAAIAGLSDSGL
jgi:hypothetical protein